MNVSSLLVSIEQELDANFSLLLMDDEKTHRCIECLELLPESAAGIYAEDIPADYLQTKGFTEDDTDICICIGCWYPKHEHYKQIFGAM